MLTIDLTIALLVQMLDSIDSVPSRGFIHRDIKPSNFVIGKGDSSGKVYIIDFGLAKKHLQNNVPIPKRKNADFRGTITYASLNAHLKKDLSRRDDLWSFYFVIMDFFNANLPWKNISNRDEVAQVKSRCLRNPIKYLWNQNNPTEGGFDYKIKDVKQLKDIFYHIQNLKYESEPNYQLIRMLLLEIRNDYLRQCNPKIPPSFENVPRMEPPVQKNVP